VHRPYLIAVVHFHRLAHRHVLHEHHTLGRGYLPRSHRRLPAPRMHFLEVAQQHVKAGQILARRWLGRVAPGKEPVPAILRSLRLEERAERDHVGLILERVRQNEAEDPLDRVRCKSVLQLFESEVQPQHVVDPQSRERLDDIPLVKRIEVHQILHHRVLQQTTAQELAHVLSVLSDPVRSGSLCLDVSVKRSDVNGQTQ
jgi:hypothetical protein